MKKNKEELLKKLTPLQYGVTQNGATERPFTGKYNEHHEVGLYVDIVSGEPLFSSMDKFDSGCGWPSFSKPVEPREEGGLRYCVNSAALRFIPVAELEKEGYGEYLQKYVWRTNH